MTPARIAHLNKIREKAVFAKKEKARLRKEEKLKFPGLVVH